MFKLVNDFDDDDTPRYFKANDPSTWEKPDDIDTWGNYFLHPTRPLNQRQRELCRMAAHGKTNKEIAEKLNYTPTRVSVLFSNTKIQNEIERYRDLLFGADIQTRLKELAPEALGVMEGILTSDSIALPDKEVAAKWILEKVSGKAAQQVEVKGDVSIGVFLDKLDKLASRGTLPVIDVSPNPPAPQPTLESSTTTTQPMPVDEFSDWLTKNM